MEKKKKKKSLIQGANPTKLGLGGRAGGGTAEVQPLLPVLQLPWGCSFYSSHWSSMWTCSDLDSLPTESSQNFPALPALSLTAARAMGPGSLWCLGWDGKRLLVSRTRQPRGKSRNVLIRNVPLSHDAPGTSVLPELIHQPCSGTFLRSGSGLKIAHL